MQHVESPRRSLLESLDQALERLAAPSGTPGFSLLLVGLDGFTALSDILGYSLCEELSHLNAQRLASALRQQDTLLRLAGDEFVVLLDTTVSPFEESSAVAARLIDLLQRPFLIHGQVVTLTVSVGIVQGRADHTDTNAEALLNHAGIALRCARSAGPGNFHFFDVALERRLKARHVLAADLRAALLLRQFELHYQPQIEMKSRHLVGFEALVRWRHPQRGMVSPGDFIPLAEEIGLIVPLGDWVLRTACRQAALLPDHVVMAVNASPLQLRDKTFLAAVERALAAAALPARRLEIEITEGVLVQNTSTVLDTLHGLHAMGVKLAMDDFGTGYSSLGQLAKLPFDVIKIDRSLVGASVAQRAIVRAIATLGQGLGMATLAEGIETEEEAAHALSAGCNTAQGYLFGRPTPAKDLDAVLTRLCPLAAA